VVGAAAVAVAAVEAVGLEEADRRWAVGRPVGAKAAVEAVHRDLRHRHSKN